MPIRSPFDTTIGATDFQEGAYRFRVESELGPEASPGIVVVSASAGYSLLTPSSNQPRREQIIRYSRQADGGWVASAAVTILLAADAPVSGAVSVRAGTDTVVLTIDMTRLAIGPLRPVLTVNSPALTFAETTPGRPAYQVITIAQQHTDTPVTLTTDAPAVFQVASDNHPAFGPTLTLRPSPTGSHVHVRYAASRPGTHTAQLTIQSHYETKTVALQGRRSGLLPVRAFSDRTPRPRLTRRWVGPLLLVILGGLAYVGYGNRCALFPALCPDAVTNQPLSRAVPPPVSSPGVGRETSLADRTDIRRTRTTRAELPRRRIRSVSTDRPTMPPAGRPDNREDVAGSPGAVRNGRAQAQRAPVNPDGNIVDERQRRRTTPARPPDESDLERELNQPVQNQR